MSERAHLGLAKNGEKWEVGEPPAPYFHTGLQFCSLCLHVCMRHLHAVPRLDHFDTQRECLSLDSTILKLLFKINKLANI